MPALAEPEVLASLRAFATAQRLLAGVPEVRLSGVVPVGWHGTEVEELPVALVRRGGLYEELVGEIVRVSRGARTPIFAYVYGARTLPVAVELSLPRRWFLAIGLLALESADCIVEVVA